MDVKDKLKFVFPVIIAILFIISYESVIDGNSYNKQIVIMDAQDILTKQELSSISKTYELDSIENNVRAFIVLLNQLFSNIEIDNIKDVKPKAGIDKIGEFRDFYVKANGDYLNQLYLLGQINDSMRSFVVINSIKADKSNIILKARIYGRTETTTK